MIVVDFVVTRILMKIHLVAQWLANSILISGNSCVFDVAIWASFFVDRYDVLFLSCAWTEHFLHLRMTPSVMHRVSGHLSLILFSLKLWSLFGLWDNYKPFHGSHHLHVSVTICASNWSSLVRVFWMVDYLQLSSCREMTKQSFKLKSEKCS